MKLYKFIFIALLGFSIGTPVQAWIPGVPSLPTDFEECKRQAQEWSDSLKKQLTNTLSEAYKEQREKVENLTGINFQPETTPKAVQIKPTPSTVQTPKAPAATKPAPTVPTPTPTPDAPTINVGTQAPEPTNALVLAAPEPVDTNTLTIKDGAAIVATGATADQVKTLTKKIGCVDVKKQLSDFNKTFKDFRDKELKSNISPSSTASYTTRLLDTLDDPWVRIAVVTGIVIYARYKYNQSQAQLEDFGEEKENE